MRALVTAVVLLYAAALPLAAHADTLDVMTVTGNGHTWTFVFPSIETFDYAANIPQFVPGLTPVSETIDGASVSPTELFFHPGGLNIIDPFGTIMYLNVLNVVSVTGPFAANAQFPGGYDQYTSTFLTGTWPAFGTSFNGISPTTTDYTVNIQELSTTATPEPSSLALLATSILGLGGVLKRRLAR